MYLLAEMGQREGRRARALWYHLPRDLYFSHISRCNSWCLFGMKILNSENRDSSSMIHRLLSIWEQESFFSLNATNTLWNSWNCSVERKRLTRLRKVSGVVVWGCWCCCCCWWWWLGSAGTRRGWEGDVGSKSGSMASERGALWNLKNWTSLDCSSPNTDTEAMEERVHVGSCLIISLLL